MAANFGKYELHQRLAIGGMAEIFLAQVKGVEGFSKTIVLKRILPHLAEEQEFVRMFIDEAKLASTLTHPNIVQVYELGSIDNRYFIAMEYIPGIDLSTLTKRIWHTGEPVPPGAALAISIDALRGLHYAHEKKDPEGKSLGLVHRDVSPQNILLSSEGMTKITDFGIAKAEGKSTKTRSGVLKGKFSYMAPEQAFGKNIDRRADLFAMALVTYELFTSKRAYKSDNELEMLDMAREAKLRPLAEVIPGFPQTLSKVMEKALASNQEDRFGTCAELANALQREGHALADIYDSDQVAELVMKFSKAVVINSPTEIPELTDSEVMAVDDGDHMLTTPMSDVRKLESKRVQAPPTSAQNTSTQPSAPAAPNRVPILAIGGGVIIVLIGIILGQQMAKQPAPAPAPETRAPELAPIPKTPVDATPPTTAPDPTSQPATQPVAAKDNSPKQPSPGYLMLNSRPWAYIYIDGKKLPNTTPLQKQRLSAGQHKVKLESPGAGRSEEFTVTIKAGQTEKKIVDFDKK